MSTTGWSNEFWVESLGCEGPARDRAIAELRLLLENGLAASFRSRKFDEAFVQDAVQESLIRILEKLDQFAFRSRFTTWALAIASRVALTELRRRHWRNVSLDSVSGDGTFEVHDDAQAARPGDQAARAALIDCLKRVVDGQLTEKQRIAMNAELAGMPQEEIARRTGSNRNAIYKLMHDARKKLKRGLEDAGYSAADVLATLA